MADENKGDSNDIIWLIVGLFVGIYGAAYFFGDNIKTFYLTIKLYELKLIGLIYATEDMKHIMNVIETKDISSWKWGELLTVGSYVGRIINGFILAISAWYVYKIYKKNPYKKLTRSLDMMGLMNSEKHIWPFLTPISHKNLLNEPIDSGPYAMAMKPIEFVDKFKLLDKPKDLSSLNKMKAEKLFSSQLGKLWDTVDNLNPYCQALFGVFAAQAAGETWKDVLDKEGKPTKSLDAARDVLYKLAASADNGKKPDFKLAKHLVDRYKNDERSLKIMNRHAYVYTALATLYIEACKNGVLPPNNLLWLKTINRPFYFFLNCVGRRVAWVEVAGIFGHWKAEKVSNHPIEKPFVVKAREGLEKALQEIKLADEA